MFSIGGGEEGNALAGDLAIYHAGGGQWFLSAGSWGMGRRFLFAGRADQAEIQFPAFQVHTGHGHPDHIA